MPAEDFLHHHPEFKELILIVSEEQRVDPYLAEKDYWIMHCLYGLQQGGYEFQLKGGTSLSKGHGIINRFSEDIDILIVPSLMFDLKIGKNHKKEHHIAGRKNYYERLAREIRIEDVHTNEHVEFVDKRYRSAGIRLIYKSNFEIGKTAAKDGVLLEVGFDNVTPNVPKDFSSWAFEHAVSSGVKIIDNRALNVLCYEAKYTFVEKLQAIAKSYRKFEEKGELDTNIARHYYDVYCLLKDASVTTFADTPEFNEYRKDRFSARDFAKPLSLNQAFLLFDTKYFETVKAIYVAERAFYHNGQPEFGEVVATLRTWVKDR